MTSNPRRTAVIIGAGPAGLTAAFELLRHTDIQPIVYEASDTFGGLSRTVHYKGNRIDIGGHRFFSTSERVMAWWLDILPPARPDDLDAASFDVFYQNKRRSVTLPENPPDPQAVDRCMLVRRRLSRIYFARRFFDYPLRLNLATLRRLGPRRLWRIGLGYLAARLRPIHPEKNLEDFFINRFGRELYQTFFKAYTEKVWGVPCTEIPPDWGRQRIKGLSVGRALRHALARPFRRKADMHQRGVDQSLIERFLYPKYGPGQMWEEVARRVMEGGGRVHLQREVVGLHRSGDRVTGVTVRDPHTGARERVAADYVISTMPVRALIAALDGPVPETVREIAAGLQYRDFITVGLLLKKLCIRDAAHPRDVPADNWIYVQEPDVHVGRLQIYNNWSPYMVADPDTVWLGMEYFCNVGDTLWSRDDAAFAAMAIEELAHIGIIDRADVLDQVVVRMPKTYPGYFGAAYARFDTLRAFTDAVDNLFLIGRNGMHRYNNQDHSMLTAMAAVAQIAAGRTDKSPVWAVNTEPVYHERTADG